MKLLTIAAFLVTIALAVVVFWIVWNNRSSEKIVGGVLPILIAAGVGVAVVLALSGEPPVVQTFPAMFVYRPSDSMPVNVPFRPVQHGLFLVSELHRLAPEAVGAPGEAGLLYHHLLQRSIVDHLASRYRGSWQMDVVRMSLQGTRMELFEPAQGAEPSRVIDSAGIDALLHDNRFRQAPRSPMSSQFSVPEGTVVTVVTPTDQQSAGELRFANDFCVLTIRTKGGTGYAGGGGYMALAGLDRFTPGMWSAIYVVRVTTEYSRLRSGHPMMPLIKAWATELIEEIRKEFDEERMWSNVRETYLLQRLLPPQLETKGPLGTVGEPPTPPSGSR